MPLRRELLFFVQFLSFFPIPKNGGIQRYPDANRKNGLRGEVSDYYGRKKKERARKCSDDDRESRRGRTAGVVFCSD